MRDQAHGLRNLIQQTEPLVPVNEAFVPHLMVVSGAQGGVGTTTVAVNLAAAMAQQGRRIVLVDADMRGGNLSQLCGIDEDAEAARWDEVAQQTVVPGPVGLQIVPLRGMVQGPGDALAASHQRVARQLKSLRHLGEFILVDAGTGPSAMMRSLWKTAHGVLVITTPDALSVMDTYALIKTTLDTRFRPQLLTLVNQSTADDVADDVQRRLNESCQRFLGQFVMSAGQIPLDTLLAVGAETRVPATIQSPTSAAARAVERLATQLLYRLNDQRTSA